jgi:hypothetical protein
MPLISRPKVDWLNSPSQPPPELDEFWSSLQFLYRVVGFEDEGRVIVLRVADHYYTYGRQDTPLWPKTLGRRIRLHYNTLLERAARLPNVHVWLNTPPDGRRPPRPPEPWAR